MTVIVTNIVRNDAGAETANANDTAPLIPHTDINNISSEDHETPPTLASLENIKTFNTLPENAAHIWPTCHN